MRIKNRRWILTCGFHLIICSLFLPTQAEEAINDASAQENIESKALPKEHRGIFSPRMDYDQWKPLGRGDPLKNDPTYDYVPPKLDRVHYWVDTTPRKPDPDPKKTEILVLGVSSKKPSTGSSSNVNSRTDYDTLLKFLDGTKLGQNVKNLSFQRQRPPHYSVPVTQYFPSQNFYSTNTKTRHHTQPERVTYTKGEQRVPYTMLVPPPMPSAPRPLEMRPYKPSPIVSTTAATPTSTPYTQTNNSTNSTSGVIAQESKLVYQSSSLSVADEWGAQSKDQSTSNSNSPSIVWNSTSGVQKNKSSHIPLVLAPESFILKEHFPSKSSENAIMVGGEVFEDSMPSGSSMMEQSNDIPLPMRKGQVTDESMDISNAYVNIGKPDAQIQASVEDVAVVKETMKPMTLQAMQTMQTMQPPPIVMKPKPINSLHALLQKEITPPNFVTQVPITTFRPITTTAYVPLTSTVPTSTTPQTPIPTTTTPTPLTTDTLFKHYKQPVEPLKGPMYLIIQGHSKVKTYGPTKSVHGIQVQETNEIPTAEEDDRTQKRVEGYSLQDHLNLLGGLGMNERGRLGRVQADEETSSERRGRSQRLQTLNHAVQSGYGAIGVPLDRVDEGGEDLEYVPLELEGVGGEDGSAREQRYVYDHTDKNDKVDDEKKKPLPWHGLTTLSHVVQSGLGAIGVPLDDARHAKSRKTRSEPNQNLAASSKESFAAISRVPFGSLNQKDEDIQETEFVLRYEVAKDAPTSERYFKGIVEAGDMSRKLH